MTSNDARVAIVTGAARGLGFAIAKTLHAQGIRVAIVDQLDEVKSAAEQLRADAHVVDVSDEAAVQQCVGDVADRYGRIDILVNNAGITIKRGRWRVPTEETTLHDWQRVLAVNLTGTFLFCRACIPLMRRRKWGRIINISSQAGRTSSQFSGSSYAASKAGLIGFSRILAAEAGEEGITVNCIAPGRIRSPMNAVSGEDANTAYLDRIPVRRIGMPEDVAASVGFLASEEASYITGAVIDVNGGAFMG